MRLRMAVLTDLHYDSADAPSHADRRGDIAHVLLLRAVYRMKRLLHPDVLAIPGDVLDEGRSPRAPGDMAELKQRLDRLEIPRLILPGNHDCDTPTFQQAFGQVPEWLDVNGFRLVPLIDPEEAGFNAHRTEQNFHRIDRAREGYAGPLIAVHHVPVFPEGTTGSPYNYVNAGSVIDNMRRNGCCLALSGHYHHGFHTRDDDIDFVCAAATCVSPFPVTIVDLDWEPGTGCATRSGHPCPQVRVSRHNLRLPESLSLVDCHVHTQFAYCGEDTDVNRVLALSADMGLADVAFSEHSNQLYFDAASCHRAPALDRSWEQHASPHDRRMDDYLDLLRRVVPPRSRGFEVECSHTGGHILAGPDARHAAFLIGGMHQLAELEKPVPAAEKLADDFLAAADRFTASGINVLAHPFRVFRRTGLTAPPELFDPLVRMLRERNVAAEINFHTNEPPEAFFRLCLDAGVPIAFGSDTHNLYELGDFALHLDFLKRCGFDGDPMDVIIDPRRLNPRR